MGNERFNSLAKVVVVHVPYKGISASNVTIFSDVRRMSVTKEPHRSRLHCVRTRLMRFALLTDILLPTLFLPRCKPSHCRCAPRAVLLRFRRSFDRRLHVRDAHPITLLCSLR